MSAESDSELLEVFSPDGRMLGLRRRGEIHGDPALIHRAVHVVVRDAAGRIYLQKRSRNKRIQPGRWDTSVGGHVDPGESYRQAALRELHEELGVALADPETLEELHRYTWRSAVETELICTFALEHQGPFELHPEEIEEGRFWTAAELIRARGGGALTPNLEHELGLLGVVRPDGSDGTG